MGNGKRTLPGLELALAGAAATMIGDAALHPIDCIKTLQQSNNGIGLSMIGAGKKIFADQGIPGFFNGLGCYVACDGAAGAIKFATNTLFILPCNKPIFSKSQNQHCQNKFHAYCSTHYSCKL